MSEENATKERKVSVPQDQVLAWLKETVESATGIRSVRIDDNSRVEYQLDTPAGTVTILIGADRILKAMGFG